MKVDKRMLEHWTWDNYTQNPSFMEFLEMFWAKEMWISAVYWLLFQLSPNTLIKAVYGTKWFILAHGLIGLFCFGGTVLASGGWGTWSHSHLLCAVDWWVLVLSSPFRQPRTLGNEWCYPQHNLSQVCRNFHLIEDSSSWHLRLATISSCLGLI